MACREEKQKYHSLKSHVKQCSSNLSQNIAAMLTKLTVTNPLLHWIHSSLVVTLCRRHHPPAPLKCIL